MSPNASLVAGAIALAVTCVDAWKTQAFVNRPVAEQPPVASATSAGAANDELQALRMKVEELNREMLGLNSGPITSLQQLERAVNTYLDMRERREKVHKFAIGPAKVRKFANDWAERIVPAYNLAGEGAIEAKSILSRLADGLESLSKSTGGEPELEGEIAARFDAADRDLMALLAEDVRKRYRPIPRSWASGLVANVEEPPR